MKYKIILVFTAICCSYFTINAQVLKPINYADINIGGELKYRIQRNYDRLESDTYTTDKIFPVKKENNLVEWPGDIEGRIILGLVSEAQANHREPKYLEEMIRILPEKVNRLGYFGPIENCTVLEQQLSGNGWYLRALCEYYLWKKDIKVRSYIKNVVNNLVLPTKGYHSDYPISPKDRNKKVGAAIGATQATISRWKLSSDIGCDFIFMDGVVQAYGIMPSPPLKSVIDEMIARFLQVDLKAISAQTHATLTGIRALLRYYEITKQPYLLKAAAERYKVYRLNALTANFENFNWFERPEWTEPCAIVDSYMAAVQLWQFTRNPVYLEDAHHIYFNAIANTQRANGGFGLSNCTIPNKNTLKVIENEAWWCCTMRGGEGLASAVRYSYFLGGNKIIVPFFNTSQASIRLNKKLILLKQTSAYPFEGKVSFGVLRSSLTLPFVMELIAPSWTRNHKLTLNGTPLPFIKRNGFLVFKTRAFSGDKIELTFDQQNEVLHMVNEEYSQPDYFTLSYGALLLGITNNSNGNLEVSFDKKPELVRISETNWKVKKKEVYLSPVYHLLDPAVTKESGYSKQILFKIGTEVSKSMR